MSSSIKISPSILSADFSKLGEEIIALEKAGADYIHIDVMDGHFVPNITIGPEVIKRLRPITKLTFDVHLMISPVNNYIKNFAEAGADIITFHPEATESVSETINLIKKLGKKVGVSLKPKSQINLIEDYSVSETTNDYTKIRLKYRGKLNKLKDKLLEKKIIIKIVDYKWRIKVN